MVAAPKLTASGTAADHRPRLAATGRGVAAFGGGAVVSCLPLTESMTPLGVRTQYIQPGHGSWSVAATGAPQLSGSRLRDVAVPAARGTIAGARGGQGGSDSTDRPKEHPTNNGV